MYNHVYRKAVVLLKLRQELVVGKRQKYKHSEIKLKVHNKLMPYEAKIVIIRANLTRLNLNQSNKQLDLLEHIANKHIA